MNRPLTKQQQTVYDYIRDKILTRGYGPTVREIGDHMNIKSPNGVMCHLRALERKGMITRTANRSRAIELTEPISRLSSLELEVGGDVVGGACLLEDQRTDRWDLSRLANEEHFGLRVRDESLADLQIRTGDLLIARRQAIATQGQLAIVRTHDGEVSLRFWFADSNGVRLQPTNRNLPPMIVDYAEVMGVVISMVRTLEGWQPGATAAGTCPMNRPSFN